MFFIFSIFNSLMFMNMKHPLSMGFFLMTQTFLISLSTGLISKSFWFSYSLFLIFMGGMLILIMYMTSLAHNELFFIFLNKKNFFLFFFLFLLILLLMNFNTIIFNLTNFENTPLLDFYFQNKENNLLINKMFNFPTNFLLILLVTYMFFTLILSVKITNIYKGPIRMK